MQIQTRRIHNKKSNKTVLGKVAVAEAKEYYEVTIDGIHTLVKREVVDLFMTEGKNQINEQAQTIQEQAEAIKKVQSIANARTAEVAKIKEQLEEEKERASANAIQASQALYWVRRCKDTEKAWDKQKDEIKQIKKENKKLSNQVEDLQQETLKLRSAIASSVQQFANVATELAQSV